MTIGGIFGSELTRKTKIKESIESKVVTKIQKIIGDKKYNFSNEISCKIALRVKYKDYEVVAKEVNRLKLNMR